MQAGRDQELFAKLEELKREIEQASAAPPSGRPLDERIPQAMQLLERALAARASDVHIDPVGGELEIRFRVDGRLNTFARVAPEVGRPLVNQLELLAGIDLGHHFGPHESRLYLPQAWDGYHVRITTTPTTGGEALALRILHKDRLVRPLEALGLSPDDQERLEQLLEGGEGLLLVTGPTGAGKTTTVYSMLHVLNNGARSIVTIEDPVEFAIPAYRQVNVDLRHGLTMAAGLRTLLRMDPDVIMVGEIRDVETAEMTMRAASAGKMVFSTIHTRDAASTITAMHDLRTDIRSLGSNLVGIVSQRLVRRLCAKCRRRRPASPAAREFFGNHDVEPPEFLHEATGCEECRDGYFDRVGVFEVAPTSPALVGELQSGAPEERIRDELRSAGVRSLLQDGLKKVAEGLTTLHEIEHMHWGTAVTFPQNGALRFSVPEDCKVDDRD